MTYLLKTDQAKSSRRHYLANAKKIKLRSRVFLLEKRKENNRFVWGYKSMHPCVDCGESNPIVLDFDHIGQDKDRSIARAVNDGFSMERLLLEMKKCEVVCSNCHRIRTYNRRIAGKSTGAMNVS